MQTLAALFAACSVSLLVMGSFYQYLQPSLASDRKRAFVDRTRAALFGDERTARHARRQMIMERLAQLSRDEQARRGAGDRARAVELRLERSGLSWSRSQYRRVQIGVSVLAFLVLLVATGSVILSLPLAFAAGFMLPAAYLERKIAARYAAFSHELPNALDVLVRGTRAGLPVSECIRSVAREAAEPVRTEFELVVHAQSIGASLTDATEMLAHRVPISDTRFLAIAISIQETEGGAIADTLSNLSNTLRERRKLNEKIEAMGSSARSSAKALAAMPFLLLGLTYFMDPERTQVLWTTTSGRIVTAVCIVWVLIGFFVLKRMQDNAMSGG